MRFIRRIVKLLALFTVICLTVVACQVVRNSGETPLPTPVAEATRVATYNVHYIIMGAATGPWSRGDWDRRRGPLDLAFKAIDADVIAFQEMESFSRGDESRDNLALDWLLERNPGYAAAAVGDPSAFPSTQPILYRTDRLDMLDQGWFFFSDTPDVIYSRTFNDSFPAFASWAQFRDRGTGADFRVLNVHTDYATQSNRLRSIALTAERAAPWIAAGETVLLAGDLNARLGDRGVEILQEAGFTFAPVKGATYHFNRGLNLFGAIDHLAWFGAVAPLGPPVVLRQRFEGEWPTDHYPVIIDLRFE